MSNSPLNDLEARIARLTAAYRQLKLEKKRALQERDRLLALNAEQKRRVEAVVERLRQMESEPPPNV